MIKKNAITRYLEHALLLHSTFVTTFNLRFLTIERYTTPLLSAPIFTNTDWKCQSTSLRTMPERLKLLRRIIVPS